MNQSYLHCDCAGQKNADKEKRIKEWNEKFSKAVEVDEKDVDTMLYCEEFDEYYDSTDDFLTIMPRIIVTVDMKDLECYG